MAHHASAKKRIRTSEKRRLRNKATLSRVKTEMKKVLSSVKAEDAEKNLKTAVSVIDKAVSKGRLHKNTAARKKARLTKFVNSLAAKN